MSSWQERLASLLKLVGTINPEHPDLKCLVLEALKEPLNSLSREDPWEQREEIAKASLYRFCQGYKASKTLH